jgi:16S rRNA U516 pseudouridylate synthase RsuA-like enzyme
MLLYYDPETIEACELTVVDGRLDIDTKCLLLLHSKIPEAL